MNKRKKIFASLSLIALMIFSVSCETFDNYVRRGIRGENLYELEVFGEDLSKNIKVVELSGFNIEDYKNDRVQYYIKRYQGSWRPWMQKILDNSQIYLPYVKKIFKEKGVPEDLCYLPIIESDFNPQAVSHAGAAGLWQFMPRTGAIYKLNVNYWVDDRFDPERSTPAAAEHLLRLNKNFKSWMLALIAYNAGGGRISKAIKKVKSNNFWVLVEADALPKETDDYIPKYIAALMIAKNPEKFGFKINKPNIIFPQGDIVYVDDAVDLNIIANMIDVNPADIKALNPHLSRQVTPPGMLRYPLRVPQGKEEVFYSTFGKIPQNERVTFRRHEVRMNETLSHLSSFYKVPISAILQINKMRSANSLKVGQMVMIPIQGLDNAKQVDMNQYEEAKKKARDGRFVHFQSLPKPDYDYKDIMYHVRDGDTLWIIARKFSVDMSEIKAWNEIKGDTLSIGTELFLRIPINK